MIATHSQISNHHILMEQWLNISYQIHLNRLHQLNLLSFTLCESKRVLKKKISKQHLKILELSKCVPKKDPHVSFASLSTLKNRLCNAWDFADTLFELLLSFIHFYYYIFLNKYLFWVSLTFENIWNIENKQ